ncbi:hypothetical protein ACFWJS_33830 [Streptomyces sp. NPDC127061]
MYRAMSLDTYDIDGVTEAEAAAYGDDVRDEWEALHDASLTAEAVRLAHS